MANRQKKENPIVEKLIDRTFSATMKILGLSPATPPKKIVRNPGRLNEWMVEGEVSLLSGGQEENVWFGFTQIQSQINFELKESSIVGPSLMAVTFEAGGQDAPVVKGDHPSGKRIVSFLSHNRVLHFLPFWLRGLKENGDFLFEGMKTNKPVLFKENGWDIKLHDYLPYYDYPFPREINLSSDAAKVNFRVIRVETGFLENFCVVKNRGESNLSGVDAITVTSGMLPKWIASDQFCAQLSKIHGGVHDPRHGIFGPDSIMWKINRLIAPSVTGSIRALLLQIAHPWVTAGIDDHSNVRNDPIERGRRTFSYMYTIIFGSLPQAMRAANQIHGIHKHIQGNLPYPAGRFKENSHYQASETNAMIWVQATLWDTLLRMYEKVEGKLTSREKEQFYEESKLFAMMFGLHEDDLPKTLKDFHRYCEEMWAGNTLSVTTATLSLAKELFRLRSPAFILGIPVIKAISAAELPPRIADAYGLNRGPVVRFFSSVVIFTIRVVSRLLPDSLRCNMMYQEAYARVHGKVSHPQLRRFLSFATGRPTIVN